MGAKEVERAGLVEDGGGKVSRGCAYIKSEFSIEGRMQGKMGFIVKHHFVP